MCNVTGIFLILRARFFQKGNNLENGNFTVFIDFLDFLLRKKVISKRFMGKSSKGQGLKR